MGAHESRDCDTQGKYRWIDGDAQGNSGWLISGHEQIRFGYGNLGKVRSENLDNIKFWKVVRMRHAIVENDGMPRGILLQRSVFPNMPYRDKKSKIMKLPKIKTNLGPLAPISPCGLGLWYLCSSLAEVVPMTLASRQWTLPHRPRRPSRLEPFDYSSLP